MGEASGPDGWGEVPGEWLRARTAAYELIDRVQRDPGTRPSEPAGGGWPDVAFLHVFAELCAAELRHEDLRPAVVRLAEIAGQAGEPAFAAIVLALSSYGPDLAAAADRAAGRSPEESAESPLARVAEAVAILERRDGSPVHRPLAWIDCAMAYRRHGLWELEEEMYAEAGLDLGDGWPDGHDRIRFLDRRVVELNRLEARAQLTAESLEAGDPDAAAALARDGMTLPGPDRGDGGLEWAAHAAALRGLLAAVAGDEVPGDGGAASGAAWRPWHDLERAVRAVLAGDPAAAAGHAGRIGDRLAHMPALHSLALSLAARRPPVAPATAAYEAMLVRTRRDARRHLLAAARMHREHERLRYENRRLAERAHADQLTGLANRHAYELHLSGLRGSAGARVGVLLLDVDWFKRINDTHGHAVGDEVLRRVAAALRARVRPGDLVARLGGDEFIALLDAGDEAVVAGRAQDTVDDILTARWEHIAGDLRVGVSAGFAVGPADQVDAVIAEADRRLYVAKGRGRARLVAAEH
ncbi:MAG: GGDEF domain-containing protein [Thermoleophilia bacterium]